MKDSILVVKLTDGNQISIPSLSLELIENIFNYHAAYLDKDHNIPTSLTELKSKIRDNILDKFPDIESEPSIQFAIGAWDGMGGSMQHDPAQANAPDLPQEMLQKLSDVAKIVAPQENVVLPKAEHNCNCFYCQIARAINPEIVDVTCSESVGEEVTAEELVFQDWNIKQAGENLYTVTNNLDQHEQYNVFLGDPIGCTCGRESCEHIVAVLKS